MKSTISLKSQRNTEFLYRGDALAAGGFLTRLRGEPVDLDPKFPTTNGESRLPMIGGISHAVVEEPAHRFPEFLNYGRCETFVQGAPAGADTVTTLRASVDKVQLTTSPSPEDDVAGVSSISFRADRLAIEVRSTHPQIGQARFEIVGAPEALGTSLTVTCPDGTATTYPIRLVFDERLLALTTLHDLDTEFQTNREFFDEHAPRFPKLRRPMFGRSRIPRTREGYVLHSIVKQIAVGDEVIPGNVLSKKGFGSITFGLLLTDASSRRIAMAHARLGSDPGLSADFSCVSTNGIWK